MPRQVEEGDPKDKPVDSGKGRGEVSASEP
jgi:hypothetical protein